MRAFADIRNWRILSLWVIVGSVATGGCKNIWLKEESEASIASNASAKRNFGYVLSLDIDSLDNNDSNIDSSDSESNLSAKIRVPVYSAAFMVGGEPMCSYTLDENSALLLDTADDNGFRNDEEDRFLVAVAADNELKCVDNEGKGVEVSAAYVYLDKLRQSNQSTGDQRSSPNLILTYLGPTMRSQAVAGGAAAVPAVSGSSTARFVPGVEHICQYTDGVRGAERVSCQTTAVTIFLRHILQKIGKNGNEIPNATKVASVAGGGSNSGRGRQRLKVMQNAFDELRSHWLPSQPNNIRDALTFIPNEASVGSALTYIKGQISAGIPVLVRGNFTAAGHWMVAVGFDDEAACEGYDAHGNAVNLGKGKMYFSDPAGLWDTGFPKGTYYSLAFVGGNATQAAWAQTRQWCGQNLGECCARGSYVGYCYVHLGRRGNGHVLWGGNFDAVSLKREHPATKAFFSAR